MMVHCPRPCSRLSRNLILRTLSTLVLVPLAVWAIVQGDLVFSVMAGLVGALMVHEWIGLHRVTARKNKNHVALVLGTIYIPLLMMSGLLTRQALGAEGFLIMIAMVWLYDTFAYVTGCTIGGAKIAPRLSPNKTWAGYVGGMLAGVVFTLGVVVLHRGMTSGSALLAGVVYAVLMANLIHVGGLTVSLFKRRAGVKDSGHLIPGHGGVLDRVDGLIYVLPLNTLGVFLCDLYSATRCRDFFLMY